MCYTKVNLLLLVVVVYKRLCHDLQCNNYLMHMYISLTCCVNKYLQLCNDYDNKIDDNNNINNDYRPVSFYSLSFLCVTPEQMPIILV